MREYEKIKLNGNKDLDFTFFVAHTITSLDTIP